MRKVSKILLFFISFFIVLDVKASCSYTTLANLKKLASNVNVTYTYNIVENTATFNIRFANLTRDIYVYDSYNDKSYYDTGEIVLNDFKDGTKYRFFIKSNDSNCKDELLMTKYISLPKYNKFYGDPICNGIENYTLCQKWGTFNTTSYSDYKNQINKYKASLNKEKVVIDEEKKLTFIFKYYLFIFITIIIIGSLLIYYLYKKDKYNF